MHTQDPRVPELGDLRDTMLSVAPGEPVTIGFHGARSPLHFLVLLPSTARKTHRVIGLLCDVGEREGDRRIPHCWL